MTMVGMSDVLYRKYRPQRFEDLTGQRAIVTTLTNQLLFGSTAHAYCFSGPRGVGKTTIARLLAKALNCTQRASDSAEPCLECAQCLAMTQGNSLDLIEVDAASHTGVDHVRDAIIAATRVATAGAKYKVFIIDEVHMLSISAFNALLKTLEEPPSHTVFMLATTEAQKMPATILSRCQRFALRPILAEAMMGRLGFIVKKEKLTVDGPALEEIVRSAGGSMRDALSLLDQVVVFAPQGAGRDAVRELLGLLSQETVASFMAVLKANDPKTIVSEVVKYLEKGGDLSQLARDLQERCHLLLQVKAGLESFPGEDLAELSRSAKAYSFDELERNIRLLGRCLEEMRKSPCPQAVFQAFCLRMSQPGVDIASLSRRLEALERKISQSGGAQKSVPPEVSSAPPDPPAFKPPDPLPPPPVSSEFSADPKPDSSERIDADLLRTQWPSFVQEVQKAKPSLGHCLEDAEASVTAEGSILLTFSFPTF